ncbi:MAG: pentapeptide repeat-containing protein [Alphaproteobacteria bacterium]|nr:pentapeptide repeat-containing protein [Alphaproteobacteria bacterium]
MWSWRSPAVQAASRALAVICLLITAAAQFLPDALAQGPNLSAMPRRPSVWHLALSTHALAMPPGEAYINYACGANGGPPARPLSGWADYALCPADPEGRHEIAFEYDDEGEFIAKALDNSAFVGRFSGTAEQRHPIIVSALFTAEGVLDGIRVVTDPRADRIGSAAWVQLFPREEAFKLAAFLAARFDIEEPHCIDLPREAREGDVGGQFIKRRCERVDEPSGRRVLLGANLLRKPGQAGVNPFVPGEMTEGQFESWTRLEVMRLKKSAAGDAAIAAQAIAAHSALTPPPPPRKDCPGCALAGANFKRQDLTNADFRGANLAGANLHEAKLAGADLTGADLSGANLNKADLRRAKLAGAKLPRAMLFGAKLGAADLTRADLTNAMMRTVDLTRATLEGASVTGVDLREARMANTHLAGADFSHSGLDNSQMAGADLTNAKLVETNLFQVSLREAILRGANCSLAIIYDSDLKGADLTGANFTGADLTSTILTDARIDGADFTDAVMPDGQVQKRAP